MINAAAIVFRNGSNDRHEILLDSSVTVKWRNTAASAVSAIFPTNAVSDSGWNHYVILMGVNDLTNNSPVLYKNGVNVSHAGFSGPTGTTPSINGLKVLLDDKIGLPAFRVSPACQKK